MPQILFSWLSKRTSFLLLMAALSIGVRGVLTKDGVVTADSIWINSGDPGYSNCLAGLIDNVLWAKGSSAASDSHCCATTQNYNAVQWLNIQFTAAVTVQTVLLLNREDSCCQDRVIGSDFYVGFNSVPNQNTRCNQNPQKSGAFTCGGLVGIYLGMSNNKHDYMNICQIRAYSYVANSYTNFQYNTSTVAKCPTVSNLTFQNEKVWDNDNCKMNLEKASVAYYEMRFDV
jgi:hypothetical protein